MCNMVLNQELNGVELYFEGKPVTTILNNLKNNGFRWSNFKKCWYAKQNEKTLKLAEQLKEGKEVTAGKENINTSNNTQTKSNNMPLWDRVQFITGTADTSKYHYNFVGSNYTGLTTKETAVIIRKQLKNLFPEIKFSITSEYNSITVTIKSSPYNHSQLERSFDMSPHEYKKYEEEHNKEINAIIEYCNRLLSSYNYDDSDTQSDYFNCHFYKHVYIDYQYTQTEQTDTVKADITDFNNKLEEFKKAEEEQKEIEYQNYLIKQEEDNRLYKIRQEEEKKEVKHIYNSIDIKELEEQKQYFVINIQMANLNKNNTLNQYKEEIAKNDFYLNNVKITKEIHFQNSESLKYFSNMLLNDFDFLSNTGGSYTDDKRINSMTDYNNMTQEERETVIFNLLGVAIYYNNELQFIVDTQGYNYSRYVGLVDGATIQKECNVKQFINNEELQDLKNKAETLEDYSMEAITCDNPLINTWNNEDWNEYKTRMKQIFNKNNFKLSKSIIQQLPEESEKLKVAMYKLLIEVDGIQEQFKNANLQQGQKLTLFYISDWGGIATNRITLNNIENTSYAQYDNNVKITYIPEGKRKPYYNNFHSTLLVYNGWLELPEEVLHEVVSNNGITRMTKTKYMSCDRKQYDEILEYFAGQGIKPVVNTYKPMF